jgi:hypothetical protein
MAHPDLNRARERWESATRHLENAKAAQLAAPSALREATVTLAQWRLTMALTNWKAAIELHGALADELP